MANFGVERSRCQSLIRLPLLGEWTNEEEMHMEVAQGMISTKQAENQISQLFIRSIT